MKKLSILCPSNRPQELDRFLDSLRRNTRNMDDLEVIILVDDTQNYVEHKHDTIVIHRIPDEKVSMGVLNYECYKKSQGQWILLCNDDVIIETKNWDKILYDVMKQYPDEIALFWPRDNMFNERLACFPIVSRKVLELVEFFPTPYRRYKIDDTLHYIHPMERRVHIPQISFIHGNDKGEVGFQLEDGRIYPIDMEAAAHDNEMWEREKIRREEMKKKLRIGNSLRVLVGVPTGEITKRAMFYDYFNMLEKPAGTIMTFARGQSPAKGRNMIIKQALEYDCSHVLFLDDDVAFPSHTLDALLKHDKDIVTALHLRRNYPHYPYIFDWADENGLCRQYLPKDNETGLIEIVASGFGCCLIKTDVFKALEEPWVRLGELEKDEWCDDIGFFKRVREAGFKIYCDLDMPVGHFASLTVWPGRKENKWHTVYDTGGTSQISFPVWN